MSKKNKVYWIEGVTEKEVKNSLSDTRFNYLRNPRARKTLVVSFVAAYTLAAASDFLDLKLGSVAGLLAIALMLVIYLLLRTSIRQIADAPDELIDERQQQIRDGAYLYAYRIMAAVLCLIFIATAFGLRIAFLSEDQTTGLIVGTLFLIGALPSAVIAWGEKEE
jgi:hypothetical protein